MDEAQKPAFWSILPSYRGGHSSSIGAREFRGAVTEFVRSGSTGVTGEYTMCTGGQVTLYSSCFAAMTLHYLGALSTVSRKERLAWADYINRWQDAETGRFLGPEIVPEELTSPKHDWDHVTMHLAAHALPALHVLGARPSHPISFAHRFLDTATLRVWLDQRDWHDAWLEGNNLLFIGQFLVYLRDSEGRDEAQTSLEVYFDWLDAEQDPATGLWGTNGYCDAHTAMCGAYHPLLVYYYCERPVLRAKRITDTTLRLQHPDGGFARDGGGGACEDVDAVDILVNLYERSGYRPRAVRLALRRALDSIVSQQMSGGGFVYRRGVPFTHMGIGRTYAPVDTPNLFATWFRVHTLALACQVLRDHPLAKINWRFNDICSMGWHDPAPVPERQPDPWQDRLPVPWFRIESLLRATGRTVRRRTRSWLRCLLGPGRG